MPDKKNILETLPLASSESDDRIEIQSESTEVFACEDLAEEKNSDLYTKNFQSTVSFYPKSPFTGSLNSQQCRAERTTYLIQSSNQSSNESVIRTSNGTIYTAGRPPWFNCEGRNVKPFVIGICGGSASGKTRVAGKIIESLGVSWVTLFSMDDFYKVLTPEQHEASHRNEYNFDHPDAFDFEILVDTLKKLKEGRKVEIPIYSFVTHSRESRTTPMYGANVIIFEGIFAFHNQAVRDMLDMKIFVETDADVRLARRLKRDISERGRDLDGVLKQYMSMVQPSFIQHIEPLKVHADIIVPYGRENDIAVQLIVQHVHIQLQSRCLKLREELSQFHAFSGQPIPDRVRLATSQIKSLDKFIRNNDTARDEFIFYSKESIRLVLEHTLSLMKFNGTVAEAPQGITYEGENKICGVSILRPGETMEQAVCDVCKDIRIGKIIIQTNLTGEPELHYLRLPKDMKDYKVILMDAKVTTGAAAMMSVRVLLDHDVQQSNITLVSMLIAESGVRSVAYAFPDVQIVATAICPEINEKVCFDRHM